MPNLKNADLLSTLRPPIEWETFHLAGKRNPWPGNPSFGRKTGPLAGKRFRLFGKRRRCAISLILDITADARFRLTGKRNHWPGNDFAYLGNAVGALFR